MRVCGEVPTMWLFTHQAAHAFAPGVDDFGFGHFMQLMLPSDSATFPASHKEQLGQAEPLEKEPGRHFVQESFEPGGEVSPGSHASHEPCPGCLATRPGGHKVQNVPPEVTPNPSVSLALSVT